MDHEPARSRHEKETVRRAWPYLSWFERKAMVLAVWTWLRIAQASKWKRADLAIGALACQMIIFLACVGWFEHGGLFWWGIGVLLNCAVWLSILSVQLARRRFHWVREQA